jgi:scaffold protein (connect acetoacetyl-CoA thiolase and HMG-CoA synthase)
LNGGKKETQQMEARPFNDISYERFLSEDRLMGAKCGKCGAVSVPPRPICIKCHGSEMDWVEVKGKGKLAAFTCIAIGPPFMIKEGYDRKHPYVSGVVELEEGVKVVGRIEGVDGGKPETIRIGTPVKVEFLHRGEGESLTTFLAFRPL